MELLWDGWWPVGRPEKAWSKVVKEDTRKLSVMEDIWHIMSNPRSGKLGTLNEVDGDDEFSYIEGASSFGSVFRKTDDWEAVKVVHQALKSGINLIDCAPWYGHSKAEAVLGKVIIFI